jgi:hypothetical protein
MKREMTKADKKMKPKWKTATRSGKNLFFFKGCSEAPCLLVRLSRSFGSSSAIWPTALRSGRCPEPSVPLSPLR